VTRVFRSAALTHIVLSWPVKTVLSREAELKLIVGIDGASACRIVSIEPFRIYPGSLCEKGLNDRLNGTLHREVLNTKWFTTTKRAQIVINNWLKQYDHIRPNQALNMRSPVPETPIRIGTGLAG
jgi:integrase-like protein